jgi:hypothetical protein
MMSKPKWYEWIAIGLLGIVLSTVATFALIGFFWLILWGS